jgi:Protein of unknown function (DUF3807)
LPVHPRSRASQDEWTSRCPPISDRHQTFIDTANLPSIVLLHDLMTAAEHSAPTQVSVESFLAENDAEQLKQFHLIHFPQVEEEEDELGYYPDGVKRTLTDEQIRMFRHSEIQRLLSERRQARNRKDDHDRRQRKQVKKIIRPTRFEDDPTQLQNHVDTLMYDDQPEVEQVTSDNPAGTFLWPKIGA